MTQPLKHPAATALKPLIRGPPARALPNRIRSPPRKLSGLFLFFFNATAETNAHSHHNLIRTRTFRANFQGPRGPSLVQDSFKMPIGRIRESPTRKTRSGWSHRTGYHHSHTPSLHQILTQSGSITARFAVLIICSYYLSFNPVHLHRIIHPFVFFAVSFLYFPSRNGRRWWGRLRHSHRECKKCDCNMRLVRRACDSYFE